MDIHISLEQIEFFIALVVSGCVYGWYVYRKGLKKGWDDLAYTLCDEGIVDIDDDGEIIRVSDKEFHEYQREISYQED